MPIITGADIKYVYSGGATNQDPSLCLGDEASSFEFNGTTLFNASTAAETTDGSVCYRCIYIVNDSADSSLYNSEVYIASQVEGGSSVELGYNLVDDRQTVSFNSFGSFAGGESVDMEYEGFDLVAYPFSFDYDSDVTVMASNMETALRNDVPGMYDPVLGGVTVTGTLTGGTASFEVNFVGSAGNRFHKLMSVTSVSPPYSGTAAVVHSVEGGPINSVADSIDVETTPPTDVVFSVDSFSVGTFRNSDQLPVWVKRTVPAGSSALENDGFVARIRGTVLP